MDNWESFPKLINLFLTVGFYFRDVSVQYKVFKKIKGQPSPSV
jgi:hypothetical protein